MFSRTALRTSNLRGANPADIPYYQVSKFELSINQKTSWLSASFLPAVMERYNGWYARADENSPIKTQAENPLDGKHLSCKGRVVARSRRTLGGEVMTAEQNDQKGSFASTLEKDAAADKRQASIEVGPHKKSSVPSSPQKELHSTRKLSSPRRVRLARSTSAKRKILLLNGRCKLVYNKRATTDGNGSFCLKYTIAWVAEPPSFFEACFRPLGNDRAADR